MDKQEEEKKRTSNGKLPLGIVPGDVRPSKIRDNLYLGRLAHAVNPAGLQDLGITHIVSIIDERIVSFPEDFVYKHISEQDAPAVQLWPYFEDVTAFINAAHEAGGKVLIHCFAGVSRSATLTIAFLMLTEGLFLEQAFEEVRKSRPKIMPNSGFIAQLRDLEVRLFKKVMTPQRLTATDVGDRIVKNVEVSFEDALIGYIGSSESVVNAVGKAAIERRRQRVLAIGTEIGIEGMPKSLAHAIDSAFRFYGGQTKSDIGARQIFAKLLGQLVEEGVAGRHQPLAALQTVRGDKESWEDLLLDVPLAESFYKDLETELSLAIE